jgi:GntR family transcriptional regulator, carbon starvation induced regulator
VITRASAQDLIERHIRETTQNVVKHASHLFPSPDQEDDDRSSCVAAE